MVRDGTYVYWLMTGESQSFVYMLAVLHGR